MATVNQFLVFSLIHEKFINSIKNADIQEHTDGEYYLTFEQGTIKKSSAPFSKNIKEVLWGAPEEMYNSCLAGLMIMQGYICVPITNGWIVIKPSLIGEQKEYQLQENSCTCDAFTQNHNQPCKHLRFRDWHNQYRSKISQIKKQYE
jgi:hypothetical protein